MRKIIHCDCDSFYASVEMRDNPVLEDKPLAIGGSGPRSVVATCNYLARSYGLHSAMSMSQAKKLCPSLLIISPDMVKYKEVSRQVQRIFHDFTSLVEPLSLDEAYLDVSDVSHFYGSATLIAQEIRRRVQQEVGITISAGVANSKYLAKIASDWQKPNGLTVIQPHEVEAFVAALSVDKLFGVGKVTQRKLHSLGVRTCADLRAFSVYELTEYFGRFGQRLYELCRGIDERVVKPHRQRKSISVEHTYDDDLDDLQSCLEELPALTAELQQRISRHRGSEVLIIKQFVKLRFSDFTTTTAECLSLKVEEGVFRQLFAQAIERRDKSVRLLGVGVRLKAEEADAQIALPL
ncbi:DNA polymerase IV [Sinobacterium caligoides]|nr:DNA polymerase IV [Sinobacterium caligoides]